MDKKTKFGTQIHMQRMLPMIGWMNITIVKIHNSRSESARREEEDTGPPGNEIYGEGLSPLTPGPYTVKQDQPGSALTNNNAFSTIALPC